MWKSYIVHTVKIFLTQDIFGPRYFRPKIFLAQDIFGPRYFWPKIFLAQDILGQDILGKRYFRSKIFWVNGISQDILGQDILGQDIFSRHQYMIHICNLCCSKQTLLNLSDSILLSVKISAVLNWFFVRGFSKVHDVKKCFEF